jgi:hypothetical protein
MTDKSTMEYKLFKMLDDLVYEIEVKFCEEDVLPVNRELYERAHKLLDQYAIEQMKKMDEETLAA